MNFRAIHVRLIAWYSAWVLVVFAVFGAYTYHGVHHQFYRYLEETLARRSAAIAKHLEATGPQLSADVFAQQVSDVYSPAQSDRLIRVSTPDGKLFYRSSAPADRQFDPATLPLPAGPLPKRRLEKIADGQHMLIVSTVARQGDTLYRVEMGMPTTGAENILSGVLWMLLLGLPLAVVITAAGGYVLVRRALRPVEDIRASAENMTFGNLAQRLPVLPTGDALEHLSATLNRMLERLEGAYQQATRFSADAAHELRTPLTILRTNLETLAQDENLKPALRERLGSLLEETERLSHITDMLFALSRLDAGEGKAEHKKVDMGALAHATAEQMMLLAEEKHLKLTIENGVPVEVLGDEARLKQVIVNLLGNAIRYTPAGGQITLRIRAAEGEACLRVSDNGIGIPPEELPFVMERFYRATNARRQTETDSGAGLGLAIVQAICQAHGGQLSIASDGSGTTATVRLPLADA